MSNPFPKLEGEKRIVTGNYSSASEIVGGDTLASAVVTVAPTGLTLGTPTVDVNASTVNFYISSGTVGVLYELTCIATTVGGAKIGAQLPVQIVAILPG